MVISKTQLMACLVAILFCTAAALSTSFPFGPQSTPHIAQLIQSQLVSEATAAAINPASQSASGLSNIATSFDPQLISDYLKQIDNSGLTRASVAFNFNNELIHTAAQGCLDASCTSHADHHTRYRMGSITKTFTAVLVMKAIEEGLLTLDTPLSTFLPQTKYPIKNSDKMTIKTLLNHRAGLFSYTDNGFDLYKTYTLNDIVDIVVKNQDSQPLPDTKGKYCNTGYYFLGEILQMVYKKPYAALLNERIVSPLSLFSTYLSPMPSSSSSLSQSRPDVARGETLSFNPLTSLEWVETSQYTDYTATAAAGALVSTPKDLSSFYHGVFIQKKIISPASINLMRQYRATEGGGNYGLGIYQIFATGPNGEIHEGFGHNGFIDGFFSFSGIICSKPRETGADVLSDGYIGYFESANGFNGMTLVSNRIASFYRYMLGVPIEIPLPPNSLDPNTDNYGALAGRYTSEQFPTLPMTILHEHITREFYNPQTKSFELRTLPLLVLRPDGQIGVPLIYNPQLPQFSYVYDLLGVTVKFDPKEPNTFYFTQYSYNLVYKR